MQTPLLRTLDLAPLSTRCIPPDSAYNVRSLVYRGLALIDIHHKLVSSHRYFITHLNSLGLDLNGSSSYDMVERSKAAAQDSCSVLYAVLAARHISRGILILEYGSFARC